MVSSLNREITNLPKLIVRPVILFNVMLLQPHNCFRVVHPLEGPLGWLEVLERSQPPI